MKKRLILVLAALALVSTSLAQVQLDFWVWVAGDLTQQLADTYSEQNPGVKVNVREIVSTTYDAVLQTAMQGGQGPDVILARPNPILSEYAKAGMFMRVDEVIPDVFSYPKVLIDSVSYDGGVYAVPSALQTLQVFYNKDIFNQYGLTVPKTQAELLQAAQKLSAAGVTPFFVPGKEGWALNILPEVIGVSFLGPEFIQGLLAGKHHFTDPEFVSLLEFIKELSPYFQRNFSAANYNDMATAFSFGEAAMVFDGSWMPTNYLSNNPDLALGTFPWPPKTAGQQAYIYAYSDGGVAVNAASKHRDEAVAFVTWLASKEGNQQRALLLEQIPAHKDVEIDAAAHPNIAMLRNLLANYGAPYIFDVASPFDEGNPSVTSIMIPGVQGLFTDQLSAEALAQDVQNGLSQWYKPLQ